MKKVNLTIISRQKCQGESDEIKQSLIGEYSLSGGNAKIHYFENESYGQRVETCIYIFGNSKVVFERSGAAKYKMHIENNVPCDFVHKSAVGNLSITCVGQKIESSLCENGGTVNINYNLYAENKLLNENNITINIKEV